jgi:hypothetical protein
MEKSARQHHHQQTLAAFQWVLNAMNACEAAAAVLLCCNRQHHAADIARSHALTKQQPSSDGGLVLVMSGSATLMGGQAYGWLPGWVGVLSPHVAATGCMAEHGSIQDGCGELFLHTCAVQAAARSLLQLFRQDMEYNSSQQRQATCSKKPPSLTNCESPQLMQIHSWSSCGSRCDVAFTWGARICR